MANSFYDASGTPGTGSFGASSAVRSEFLAVQAGFDKLPTLSPAAANCAVVLNGGGTALTNTSGTLSLNGNLAVASGKTFSANSTLILGGADGKTLTVNNSIGLSGTDGKTLTLDNSLVLEGTDGATVNFGTGGTVLYSGSISNISLTGDVTGTQSGSNIAATVAEIQGKTVSGTTGTVDVVFSNSPAIVTPTISSPTVSGNALINQQSAKFTNLGNETGAFNLDLSTTPFYEMTLTGNITPSFINCPSTANYVYQFFMLIVQDATGGRTIAWPVAVHWPGGTAPANTATASKGDLWAFTTFNGGTTYLGALVCPNITP